MSWEGSDATRWARQTEAGQAVELVGPAGRHWPDPTADWHVFAGDETALPAIAAMTESLPAQAHVQVYLEIADAAEEQPLPGSVRWLHRGEAEPGQGTVLEDALAAADLSPTGATSTSAGSGTGHRRDGRPRRPVGSGR